VNSYTPVTIYPNEEGYTVVTREISGLGIQEISRTFPDYDSMVQHLKEQFGE
jgi:hypothetical protein